MSAAPVLEAPATVGLTDMLVRLHDALGDMSVVLDGGGAATVTHLQDLERASRRLDALRLRVIAELESSGAVRQSGFVRTGAWVARQTKRNRAAAARDARVAESLGMHEPASRSDAIRLALESGDISVQHADVIVQAIRDLPESLSNADRVCCEHELVRQAKRSSPSDLRLAARRALAAVEPDPAVTDAHEDSLLEREEDRAWDKAAFWLRDDHDGTMTGRFTVPVFEAEVIRKILDAMTGPRRRSAPSESAPSRSASGAPTNATQSNATQSNATPPNGAQPGRAPAPEDVVSPRERELDWAHRRGMAFAELLAHLPTDHLHEKAAATLLVTIRLSDLRGETARAGHTDTNTSMSAAAVRRIACRSGIVPLVLNGQSVPLDLGRSARVFSSAQRLALAQRYTHCSAAGCDRPFAWCELHHLDYWRHGGPTNLDNAAPLCGAHNRMIDRADTTHRVERRPDGRVTIHLRRRP